MKDIEFLKYKKNCEHKNNIYPFDNECTFYEGANWCDKNLCPMTNIKKGEKKHGRRKI